MKLTTIEPIVNNGSGVRSLNSLWSIFIPLLNDNNEFVGPTNFHKIVVHGYKLRRYTYKYEQRSLYFSDRDKYKIYSILSQLGFRKRTCLKIIRLPVKEFERLNDAVNGFIDTLVIGYPDSFSNGDDLRIVKKVIRNIYNQFVNYKYRIVDDWKRFTSYISIKYTRTLTEKANNLNTYNMYKCLLRLSVYSNMETMSPYLQLETIAHLSSTRQMPYMGDLTAVKSRRSFREITTKPIQIEEDHLLDMGKSAFRIGRYVRSIKKDLNIPGATNNSWHYSLSSAAEFKYPLKMGGKSQACMDECTKFLTQKVSGRFTNDLFDVEFRDDLEIWRYLFRESPILEGNFGESRRDDPNAPQDSMSEEYFLGIDKIFSRQVFFVAWYLYENHEGPIPIRTSVVAELGNKARVITISPWWLNVIQSPLAHALADEIKIHPSAFSSFHKGDQTWYAMCHFAKKLKTIRPNPAYFMLSSDLKDATNAQHIDLTKILITSFLSGLGYPLTGPILSTLHSLKERLVIDKQEGSFLTCRGIMMGEALAKTSLTLLNLCCAELALHKWMRLHKLEQVPLWHFVHIGGDDHIAYGPLDYLKMITENHIKSGSIISEDKHGISQFGVKYCERMVNLTNLRKGIEAASHKREDGLIIETMKVRLFEPGLSTRRAKENKNPAIGKAFHLAHIWSWFPRSPEEVTTWNMNRLKLCRHLWISRYRNFLCNENAHLSVYSMYFLPQSMGGLALGLTKEEVYTRYLLSPSLIRSIIAYLYDLYKRFKVEQTKIDIHYSGQIVSMEDRFEGFGYMDECIEDAFWNVFDIRSSIQELESILRSFNSNVTVRGTKTTKQLEMYISTFVWQRYIRRFYTKSGQKLTWDTLRDIGLVEADPSVREGFNKNDNHYLINVLKGKGYISLRNYIEWSTRGTVFQELFLRPKECTDNLFNTNKSLRTLRKVWRRLETKDKRLYQEILQYSDLSFDQFDEMTHISKIDAEDRVYLDVKEEIPFTDREGQYKRSNLMDYFNIGQPDCIVGKAQYMRGADLQQTGTSYPE